MIVVDEQTTFYEVEQITSTVHCLNLNVKHTVITFGDTRKV